MKKEKITKPEATEIWSPKPTVVSISSSGIPSDAVVLFDGTNLSEWVSVKDKRAPKWKINKDGSMEVVKGAGDIRTRKQFADLQLHIEWRAPAQIVGEGQGRGNSGVFLQERYEVQILDSYQNKTYVNGQAASIYKQHPPLVNACMPPGEWQTYDIIFHAPTFNKQGEKTESGTITLLHNGVLVQDHAIIEGTTEYIGYPKNEPHGKASIKLQDHANPVRYRNIWVREL